MTKISDILMPLYNQLLPKCESKSITLNLDLPDPTIPAPDAKNLEKITKKLVREAITRTAKKGTITITAKKGAKSPVILTIKDSGAALTREDQARLESDANTTVHSRMGYGTTITVKIPAEQAPPAA